MPVERQRIRNGIAVREQTRFTFPLSKEEDEQLERLWVSPTILERLDSIERGAREVLKEAGLPPPFTLVRRHLDGIWSELPPNWKTLSVAEQLSLLKPGERICLVGNLLQDKQLSREWYAHELLMKIASLRHCMDKGDIDSTVYIALDLGLLLKEFSINHRWGADAVRGEKVRSNKGGQQRPDYLRERRDAWARWQQQANAYWKKHPDASKNQVARWIARTADASPETIRQRINFPDELPG